MQSFKTQVDKGSIILKTWFPGSFSKLLPCEISEVIKDMKDKGGSFYRSDVEMAPLTPVYIPLTRMIKNLENMVYLYVPEENNNMEFVFLFLLAF